MYLDLQYRIKIVLLRLLSHIIRILLFWASEWSIVHANKYIVFMSLDFKIPGWKKLRYI
jgi:hypothetical protein